MSEKKPPAPAPSKRCGCVRVLGESCSDCKPTAPAPAPSGVLTREEFKETVELGFCFGESTPEGRLKTLLAHDAALRAEVESWTSGEMIRNLFARRDAEKARADKGERERDLEIAAFHKFRTEAYDREAKGGLIRTAVETRADKAEREVERLTTGRDSWMYECHAARAQRDALREALREVLPNTMGGCPDLFAPKDGWEAWEQRAAAAIKEAGE